MLILHSSTKHNIFFWWQFYKLTDAYSERQSFGNPHILASFFLSFHQLTMRLILAAEWFFSFSNCFGVATFSVVSRLSQFTWPPSLGVDFIAPHTGNLKHYLCRWSLLPTKRIWYFQRTSHLSSKLGIVGLEDLPSRCVSLPLLAMELNQTTCSLKATATSQGFCPNYLR